MVNQELGSGPKFPTTHWSVVEQVRLGDESAALQALERLLVIYQKPLQAFLMRKFLSTEDQAADWLQGFVWKKVLVSQLLANAERTKGRFRTFMATALENFVISEIRRGHCRLRSPAGGSIPLHEAPELAAAGLPSQHHQFNVAWGQAVLSETCRRMRQECLKKRQQRLWAVFEVRLLEPILSGTAPVPYKTLCAQLDFKSDAEAGNALITAKRMFARLVRSVIREYASNEGEVEAEIGELMNSFRGV